MKSQFVRRCFYLLYCLAASTLVTMPTGAKADVSCGDVITTAEVLTEDLSCSSAFDLALTVVGPGGYLDLNGFTIECDFDVDGIFLDGTGAVVTGGALSNGKVQGCGFGVEAIGSGAHTVTGIAFEGNAVSVAFVSDNNTLSNSVISETTEIGVAINGSNSTLIANEVSTSTSASGAWGVILQVGADTSYILSNMVSGFDQYGVIVCSDRNVISQNVVEGNGVEITNTATGVYLPGDTFVCDDGQEGNTIVSNEATNNNNADLGDNNFPCVNSWVGNTADVVEGACFEN